MSSTTVTFDCGVDDAYDHDATVTEIGDDYARVTCECGNWSFVGPVDDVDADDAEGFERYDGVLTGWEAHVQRAANLQWCRHHDDDDSHWIGRGDTDCGAGEVMAAAAWRLCAHDDDGRTHRLYPGESCEVFTAAAEHAAAAAVGRAVVDAGDGAEAEARGDGAERDELESWVGGLHSDDADPVYVVPDMRALESRMLAVQELHRPVRAADGKICAHCSGTGNQARVAYPCQTARILVGRGFPSASV